MANTNQAPALGNEPLPPEPPSDLITITEAARLIPGSRPGKRTHNATVIRWCQNGILRYWKRPGRTKRLFVVSRADVLALLEPGPHNDRVKNAPTARREQIEAERRQDAITRRLARELGIEDYIQ